MGIIDIFFFVIAGQLVQFFYYIYTSFVPDAFWLEWVEVQVLLEVGKVAFVEIVIS